MNSLIQKQVDEALASVRREKEPVVSPGQEYKVSRDAGIRVVNKGDLVTSEIFNGR
jgi:hypothetical protein